MVSYDGNSNRSWEEYTSRSNDDDGKSEFSMVMMTYLIIMMTSIIMMMTSLIMMMTSKAGTGHWRGKRYIMDHLSNRKLPPLETVVAVICLSIKDTCPSNFFTSQSVFLTF